MWKKIMSGLLMAVALVTLTACGSTGTTASQPASDGAKAAA